MKSSDAFNLAVGRALRKAREDQGLERINVAIVLDVNEKTIQNREQGRNMRTIQTVLDHCYALDASPIDVLSDAIKAYEKCKGSEL